MTKRPISQWYAGMAVVLLCLFLPGVLVAQGPFTSQIQRALQTLGVWGYGGGYSNGQVPVWNTAQNQFVAGTVSATPGGSATQIQYNNAGAFGGVAELTWDGTTLVINGPQPSDFLDAAFIQAVTPIDGGIAIGYNVGVQYDSALTDASGQLEPFHITGYNLGAGNIEMLTGFYVDFETYGGGGNIDRAYGTYVFFGGYDGGEITNAYGHYLLAPQGNFGNLYSFYSQDIGTGVTATNAYYFWADSRGVYRIREDNVADGAGNPQAIPAQYNPRFTKYTPGAANYERGVSQWVGNKYQIGAQAGGTGVLRETNIIGEVVSVTGSRGGDAAFYASNSSAAGGWGLAVESFVTGANDVFGAWIYLSNLSAGAVPFAKSLFIYDADNDGGGSITTQYGIEIEDLTVATNNYAIKTGLGLVSFGDQILGTAGTTSRSTLRIPHGVAPTSPVNGDMWTTTAGLFIRINGVTVGPLS